jgi:hypothetical protein
VFAGYTTTAISGVAGGREILNKQCATAFTGSHFCHASEYGLANSATPVPAAGAWIDQGAGIDAFNGTVYAITLATIETGRYIGQAAFGNCDNWTAAIDGGNPTSGAVVTPAGVFNHTCTETHVLACCSSPFQEKFRGFTTTHTTGVLAGGRAAMHAACGAQFASSHMCHIAEYYRASPTTTPPAGGAWLDGSGYFRTTFTQETFETASAQAGRFTDQAPFSNCDNWTAAVDGGNPTNGAIVTLAGSATALCTTSHPIACCQ